MDFGTRNIERKGGGRVVTIGAGALYVYMRLLVKGKNSAQFFSFVASFL
jgi:hypothetical protein